MTFADTLKTLPSIAHLAALIERKLVTSTDLTKMYIARLKRYQPTLNFYVTLTEELALKQAAQADAEIKAGKFAALYTYGTVGTQIAKTVAGNETPIIFNIVFDPVRANLVKSLQEPGGNVTGVTNGVPVAAQFGKFQALAPIKDLLVLFNAREPNSNYIEKEAGDWCQKNGVKMISRRVAPDNNSLAEVLEEIKSGKLVVDSLYAGQDNYLASAAQEIQTAVGLGELFDTLLVFENYPVDASLREQQLVLDVDELRGREVTPE